MQSDDHASQSIAYCHCRGPLDREPIGPLAPNNWFLTPPRPFSRLAGTLAGSLRMCATGDPQPGNKLQLRDLILHQLTQIYSKALLELAMDSRINPVFEQIDHRTCRSICDAVGERLQQNIRPETELSPRLQQLVNELIRRENERH
ncbi:hypothetical protein LJR220_001202 [Bradyrhizobium sp. LjRoot220]|uniref:hypothetical protein n=1 Tax=Bradyrhizobium sp. LjRoot220 TaxID=3342284 RepID=UPI003ECD3499